MAKEQGMALGSNSQGVVIPSGYPQLLPAPVEVRLVAEVQMDEAVLDILGEADCPSPVYNFPHAHSGCGVYSGMLLMWKI